ncbi:MAG: MBL fold metallo-hydrolase [Dehalococcoidales bacterium]|nr:MBL fold metallo-hydrolase [Dehalococcoidales bacterium]
MEIYYSGHACFKIKGSNATVITDPFPPDLGYSFDHPAANIVTVSHSHPGHSYTQAITDKPRIVSRPGEYEISGVLIIGISSFHDSESGSIRGKNNIFVMQVDDISICHLGDLGHVLSPAQLQEIDNVDVLLIPVGGSTTIDAPLAAQIVRQLEPKIVVPMHFKDEVSPRNLAPVDRVLTDRGAGEIVPRSKRVVTKSNLPATTQVVLLQHQALV